jgi:hypothetical protein
MGQSKNYGYSTNHQLVIDADTRMVVVVGRPLRNRNDCRAWAESGAEAAVGKATTIADGGYIGTGLFMPRRRRAGEVTDWQQPTGARAQPCERLCPGRHRRRDHARQNQDHHTARSLTGQPLGTRVENAFRGYFVEMCLGQDPPQRDGCEAPTGVPSPRTNPHPFTTSLRHADAPRRD